MKTAFISYARADGSELAEYLDLSLNGAGLDVYRDRTGLEPGARFEAEILVNIRQRDLFIVLLTPAARASAWVAKEIQAALDHGRWIVPIRCDDEALPDTVKGFDAPKLGPRADWWITLDTLARLLEDKAAPAGRVMNLSGRAVPQLENPGRLLILDTPPSRHIDLRDAAVVQAEACRLADLAGPATAALHAGIIPPGHSGLAIATLIALQGWQNLNQLPHIYWSYQRTGHPHEVSQAVGLALQEVRDYQRSRPRA